MTRLSLEELTSLQAFYMKYGTLPVEYPMPATSKIVLTHVVDPHERGGRFGEDVLSVKCRFCNTVWTDEKTFSKERIGEQPCPSRR